MSLVKQSYQNDCSCKAKGPTGKMRLRIVPKQNDMRDKPEYDETLQLMHADRLQNMFFPTMDHVDAHEHEDGFHMHPDQPKRVAHIQHLHDELDKQGLAARLTIAPGGDHSAVNVALSRDNVKELMSNGVADVDIPLSEASLRIHSTQKGRITGMEYRPA